jgi:excisionase family DNA binding protein
MDLHTHLAAIVAAMPNDGSVTLTVATLRGWMEEAPSESSSVDGIRIDLTVEQVAEKLNRSPSTIRGWLAADRLPGAYRLRGREWRIPLATLQAFLKREAGGADVEPRLAAGKIRLGAWRDFVPKS